MTHLQNVALLVKEELMHEIGVRGGCVTGDVVTLRSRLRELVAEGNEPEWPENKDLAGEMAECRRKVDEWEGGLEDLDVEVPSGRDRARQMARLGHLLARLKLVNRAPGLSATERSWLLESLGLLEQIHQGLLGAATPTNLTAPLFPRVTISNPVLPAPSTSRTVECPEMAGLPVDCSALETRVEGRLALPPRADVVASLLQYSKLPNPVAPLLQALPAVDGLDPDSLFKFISLFLKLSDLPGLCEADLLQLAVPVCRGPMADVLSAELREERLVSSFHRRVLEFFMPGRLRERLIMDRYYRPQAGGETLAGYVAAVREAHRVLRLTTSEVETVQVILDGISPTERSRLVFAGRPSTFGELHQLCITSRSVQYSDQQRVEMERNRAPPTRGAVLAIGADRPERNRGEREPTCWECGRLGHTRWECPQRQRGRPENH